MNEDADEVSNEVTQIACGTDFIVTLRGNGHCFTMGKNGCGQLGHNNFEPLD